jgi:rhamnose transport system ATP-binding protein
MPGVLLSATSITKAFAGVRALKGVSLEIHAGEVHALVGENGAGKSTLIRIMTGAEKPDSGTLVVEGRVISGLDPAAAHALGIAAVYQQPSLFPHLTVAENLAIGVERSRPWQRVDWASRRGRARELLARIGAAIDIDRTVDTLSMPEQQLVEIARALGTDARILILDEPTASLTSREVDALLDTIGRLRRDGVGIVYISHRIDEVLLVADRVTVLRDGNTVSTELAAGLTPSDVVRLMVGGDLHDPPARPPHHDGEIALELSEVGSRAAGVHGVSLSFRRGEILGLAGLVGSGRTQLAETIFGITPLDAGSISVSGKHVSIRQPADAIRARLGYVPEDRRRHGVVLDMSIAANRSLASLQQVSHRGLIDPDAEQQRALDAMRALHINDTSPLAEVSTLSGGNQQKVAVSRWLATSPSVLILDEPTQGVDVRAKGEIHRIVQELADQGMAVLLISSDLSELLLLSDRVAVMRGGTIVGALERSEASRHTVLALALGTAPLVKGLRARA